MLQNGQEVERKRERYKRIPMTNSATKNAIVTAPLVELEARSQNDWLKMHFRWS